MSSNYPMDNCPQSTFTMTSRPKLYSHGHGLIITYAKLFVYDETQLNSLNSIVT